MTGIVTYYNALNYGAFLQAYALQKFLEQEGVQSVFLPFHAYVPENTGKLLKREGEASLRFHQAVREAVGSALGGLETGRPGEHYDCVIYGSDEIWNLRNRNVLPSPMLYGWGCSADKKIAYAACCGNSRRGDFLLLPYAAAGIRRMAEVSVRDGHTAQVVEKLTARKPRLVLDPAFLISFSHLKKPNPYGRYVLVYSYGLDGPAGERIRAFADRQGAAVIAAGSYQDWADYNLAPDPYGWISLVANAWFVFTSTFHGTVFSILSRRQFWVIGKGSPKIQDLLERMGLENRFLPEEGPSEDPGDIAYDDVMARLIPQREASVKFLREALGGA